MMNMRAEPESQWRALLLVGRQLSPLQGIFLIQTCALITTYASKLVVAVSPPHKGPPHKTATNNAIAAPPAIMATSPVANGAAPVLRTDELVEALDARL